MTQSHLTDEQFGDLLLGELDAGSLPHLSECEPCRLELEKVQAAIGNFSTMSLESAEARAAERIKPMHARVLFWQVPPAWQAAAAAACISIVVLLGLHSRETQPAYPNAQLATVQVHTTSTSIAEDNNLMLAIHAELSKQEDSPVPASELEVATKDTHRSAAGELVE